MDQDERIEQLKAEARRLSAARCVVGIDNLPKDMAEQFLEARDRIRDRPHDNRLRSADRQWRAASAARRGDRSGHRRDPVARDLCAWQNFGCYSVARTISATVKSYSVLWQTVLREEVTVLPEDDTGAWHVDIPDDPEETHYLTYYASEQEREFFRKDFPDVGIAGEEVLSVQP